MELKAFIEKTQITEKIKEKSFSLVTGIAVFIIIMLVLYQGDNIGLSDNGDYPRFAYRNYIMPLEKSEHPFYYYYDKYEMNLEKGIFEVNMDGGNPYNSPHFIFLQLSKIVSIINNYFAQNLMNEYFVSSLAIIYILIYSVSIALIMDSIKNRSLLQKLSIGALMLIVLCDQGYTLYFNSFYGEAAQMVLSLFLLGVLLKILEKKGGRVWIIIYYLAVIILSGSKFTNIPIGILFGIIGLMFMGLTKDRLFWILNIGGFITTCFAVWMMINSIPVWMDDVTNYQAVFFGVLRNSDTPEADLEALGVDKKYAAIADTHGYLGGGYPINIYDEEFKNNFYPNVSKFKLLKFYIERPERFWEKLEISAKNSTYISPPYLANYGPQKDRMEFAHRFELWSKLRMILKFDNLSVIIMYFVAAGLILIIEMIRWFFYREKRMDVFIILLLWLTIIAGSGINLVIPVIGNGEADLAKHMFGFIHYFDMLAIGIWAWVGNEIRKNPIYIKVCIVVIALVLIFTFLTGLIQNKYLKPDTGAYIKYGSFEGQELVWQIIDNNNNELLLLSANIISKGQYDTGFKAEDEERKEFGSNLWEGSDIRRWLNGPFLDEIVEKEGDNQVFSEITSYLSIKDKSRSEKGRRPLYWTYVPEAVDWESEEALQKINYDRVFLLEGSELKKYVVNNNLEHRREDDYWLRTPMTSNGSMVRYVAEDGNIFHKDAKVKDMGILPAMRIEYPKEYIGEGTIKEPFEIISIR